jgi:D-alanyl-lipoteichoic acid acyltransferase DltB (MBOAT superfamily)
MLGSIIVNFGFGWVIGTLVDAGRTRWAGWAIAGAVAADLSMLAYFKYMNFFVATFSTTTGIAVDWIEIALPIGISFYTFTQIAYLVDTWRGPTRERNFIHYLLFVTYFPHLIAGPILHHGEMIRQFRSASTYIPSPRRLAAGATVAVMGLAKKTLLADPLGLYADRVFAAAGQGQVTFIDAWGGALAYTMQIYFDFSAYSEMAAGISLMFNIRLPQNFASPYKAVSIVEFWRRWHMTLSRFLRDYLYIALGGNRRGLLRRHANLLITMLLGGMWHGAGVTFIVWGGMHGLFLVVNHAWHHVSSGMPAWLGGRVLSWALTFLAVVSAWVVFRSPDMATATTMWKAMAGFDGVVIPARLAVADPAILALVGIRPGPLVVPLGPHVVLSLVLAFAIALLLPNVREIMRGEPIMLEQVGQRDSGPGAHVWWRWQPSTFWLAICIVLLATALLQISEVSQFLYFQF